MTPDGAPRAFFNARLIDPSRDLDELGTLIIADGRIVACGADANNQGVPGGTQSHDCRGLAIIPGLIDLRVHIDEPGGEHRETIASAGRAAAAGGVTSMVMMPDTKPVIDDVALVEFIMRTARDNDTVRVLPAAALTLGLEGREMSEIGNLLDAGAVLFSNGRQTLRNAAVMRRALTYARDFGAVVDHETVDQDLVADGVMNEGLFSSWLGLPGIPREAELLPLERDLRLARLTGAAYHTAKISCGLSTAAIEMAKDEGLDVTAGASIHHLTLNENDIGEYRTFFKMSPPLRSEDDRQSMIEALKDGTLDVIVSDHDPQDVDTKRLPFAEAKDGAVGLETLLSAALRLHHDGSVPLKTIIGALTFKPAKRLKLDSGTLQPGRPADFAVVDLEKPWVLDPATLKSKSKNTAFDGARFTGQVQATYVAGRELFRLVESV
ncbi:MAG: dihydroorotase [Pseudomonadota bacterium]